MGGVKGAVHEVSHVLFSSADNETGMITCQLGDVHSGEVSDPSAVVFQHWGMLSLAAPPIPKQEAAEAYSLVTGSGNVVIGGRSVRTGAIAGLIQPGETCVFADGSQASTVYKNDGSVIHFTTHDNTAAGRSVYERIGPGGFEWAMPWSRMRLDKTGFHAFHTSGARIDIGSVSGMPAPIDALSSYLSMQAQTVRINSSLISLGPDVGVRGRVLRSNGPAGVSDFEQFMQTTSTALTSVSAALVQLQSAMTAIGVALFAVPAATVPNPTGGGPAALGTALANVNTTAASAFAQFGAAEAALATAVASINAAKVSMPSSSTTST